jgi:hypothetical protein
MAPIFDHITATVLSVTVLLALLSTQMRVQQSGIEQVSAHAAKTKALALGTWLEDDITSLGANFGTDLMRFTAPVQNALGETVEWTFYSDSLGANDTRTRHLTRYVVAAVDSIGEPGARRALYQLTRQTATTPVSFGVAAPVSEGAWSEDGRSVATLSAFRIGLVERLGTDTVDPERADYIRVEFSVVPEFERHRGYLQELYWTTLLKVRPFWQQANPA